MFDPIHFSNAVLEFALEQGILVNADNFQELEVITEIMTELP